jgi:hypothetical protein
MLPSELKKAISNLQSALDGHEKIALAFFAQKLHKSGAANPEDQTINQMSLVVDRMNAGNRLFISRAEVKDLYNKLYSHNTKFKEIFAEELGLEAAAEPAASRTEEVFQEFDIYQDTDKTLLASLNAAFNPTANGLPDDIAKAAEKAVVMECSFPNLEPVVRAVSGDENVVVVAATYRTPQGNASFYVPVEMFRKTATAPSFFTGKDGQHYISKKSITNYVSNFFTKAGSHGNESVGEAFAELVEPTVDAKEVESFASNLSSAKGIAAFQHGELPEQGRRIISQKLNGFGKRSHQVNILEATKDSITYGVSCDGVAFKVPVKIESGRLQEPAVILCKGSIESFTADGIQSLQSAELTDNKVAAIVSPLFTLKASDLVETVREATEEGNYAKAEDALNVLANMDDAKAYKIALDEYTSGLSSVKKEASTAKCSRIVKTANSTQPVCGHLNLPLNKVFQDKHGDCRPMSRKGMEDSYEGAYFMNSKILY